MISVFSVGVLKGLDRAASMGHAWMAMARVISFGFWKRWDVARLVLGCCLSWSYESESFLELQSLLLFLPFPRLLGMMDDVYVFAYTFSTSSSFHLGFIFILLLRFSPRLCSCNLLVLVRF